MQFLVFRLLLPFFTLSFLFEIFLPVVVVVHFCFLYILELEVLHCLQFAHFMFSSLSLSRSFTLSFYSIISHWKSQMNFLYNSKEYVSIRKYSARLKRTRWTNKKNAKNTESIKFFPSAPCMDVCECLALVPYFQGMLLHNPQILNWTSCINYSNQQQGNNRELRESTRTPANDEWKFVFVRDTREREREKEKIGTRKATKMHQMIACDRASVQNWIKSNRIEWTSKRATTTTTTRRKNERKKTWWI